MGRGEPIERAAAWSSISSKVIHFKEIPHQKQTEKRKRHKESSFSHYSKQKKSRLVTSNGLRSKPQGAKLFQKKQIAVRDFTRQLLLF